MSSCEKRQRSKILRLALTGLGAICLPAYLVRQHGEVVGLRSDGDGEGEYETTTPPDREELAYDAQMHRFLSVLGDEQSSREEGDFSIPEYLRGDDAQALESLAKVAEEEAVHPQHELTPYDIVDVLEMKGAFDNVYGMLVYDNVSDEFLLLYPKLMMWNSGCVKLKMSFFHLTYMLRQTFPERFCGPECDEWAVGISSGDYPHLTHSCRDNFPHESEACPRREAPVLQFGSAFRNFEALPNMIAMPMPSVHLPCMKSWIMDGGKSVCNSFVGTDRTAGETRQGKQIMGSLVFGDILQDLSWENLKPQVVWRGTDFGYLNHLIYVESVDTGRLQTEQSILQEVLDMKIADPAEQKISATRMMRERYHDLLPRWKGVALTAEADREAEAAAAASKEGSKLPWADMKFTGQTVAAGIKGTAATPYQKLAEVGVSAIGKSMKAHELATYRYHIDLGGGGGTTWTGTHQKLAMPGLLFHHVTPTKDYIHDRMRPWVHYIPIKADLSDLKEKYDWAESHPEAAKGIAERGSQLMRHIGTTEGFEEMFQEDFVEPLRRVMEAYRPVDKSSSWREALKRAITERGLAGVTFRDHCTGRHHDRKVSCEAFTGKESL